MNTSFSPKTIYFDESNFTGYNLLDAQQPVFVVSTSDICEAEAEDILRSSFPLYRGEEFKFAKAWKDKRKRSLLPFAERMLPMADRVFSYVIDKRFAVLTKAIDFLIEPMLNDAGFDWYADGYCSKYANWAHYGFTQFAPPGLYEAIVSRYQTFSRNPTPQTLADMQFTFQLMANSPQGEGGFYIVLDQLALGAEKFEQYHTLENFSGSDELQVTTMVALVAHWRQRCDEDLIVIHDNSSNFYRHRSLWEKIVGPESPSRVHPINDGTTVQFPLRVIQTIGRDSKESYAIQLCDIVAGMTAKIRNAYSSEEDQKLLNDVLEAGFDQLVFNGIFFRPEFPDGPPQPKSGPDAVDMMIDTIYR